MNIRRKLTIVVGVLFVLSSTGCAGYPGFRPYNYYGGNYYQENCSPCNGTAQYYTGCNTSCETGCNTSCEGPQVCGPEVPCFSPCLPQCSASLGNLVTGSALVGRGVLDIAATPFLFVGEVLTHNYGCLDRVGNNYYGGCGGNVINTGAVPRYKTSEGPLDDGTIIEDAPAPAPIHTPVIHTTALPNPTSKVMQASYAQPKNQKPKFVQPR